MIYAVAVACGVVSFFIGRWSGKRHCYLCSYPGTAKASWRLPCGHARTEST